MLSKTKAVFDITNTGDRDGAEVAQLYVSSKCNGVYRPRKELKGFQKVFLKASETKPVEIPIDSYAFRYFNVKTNRRETGFEYNFDRRSIYGNFLCCE